MAMSAAIIDTKSRVRNDVFWFIQQSKSRSSHSDAASDNPPTMCQHPEPNCGSFVWQGFKTYLKFGLVFELVRICFSSFGQIRCDPANVLVVFAAKMKFRIVGFLVGYATAYRVSDVLIMFRSHMQH